VCASEEERGGDETRKKEEERRDEEEAGGGGVGEGWRGDETREREEERQDEEEAGGGGVGEGPAKEIKKINSVTDSSETKQKAAGSRRASAGEDGGVWEISEIRPEISEIRPSSRSAAAAVSELHIGAFSPISPYQVGVAGVALLVKKKPKPST
jgi:hypothetical protein